MSRRPSSARMRRLVTQWRATGGPQAGFARRHRIPTWAFWYWCRKIANETAAASDGGRDAAPAFVPVRLTESTDPVVEIVLGGGEHVQVRAGASAELVRAAVLALRGTC